MPNHQVQNPGKIKALRLLITVLAVLTVGFSLFNYFYSDVIDATVTTVKGVTHSNDKIYTITYQYNGVQQKSTVRSFHFRAHSGDEVQLRYSKLFARTVYTIDDLINPIVLSIIIMVLFLPLLKMIETGKIVLPQKNNLPDVHNPDH